MNRLVISNQTNKFYIKKQNYFSRLQFIPFSGIFIKL